MVVPLVTLMTVKLRVTGVAAPKAAFPACVAVMEQVPAATIVTIAPATLQTAAVVEAKLTVRPELAAAVIANGAMPKLTSLSGPNSMAWL
jgi:hypothetical protein